MCCYDLFVLLALFRFVLAFCCQLLFQLCVQARGELAHHDIPPHNMATHTATQYKHNTAPLKRNGCQLLRCCVHGCMLYVYAFCACGMHVGMCACCSSAVHAFPSTRCNLCRRHDKLHSVDVNTCTTYEQHAYLHACTTHAQRAPHKMQPCTQTTHTHNM